MSFYQRAVRSGILSVILLLAATDIFAEPMSESSYRKAFYNTFISRNMPKWEELIRNMETSGYTRTVDQKLNLINAYYGYIGHLIGKKKYDPIDDYIEKGEKQIRDVLRMSPNNATAYAFKGSFLGFRMGLNKIKAIYLESDSKEYINKSLEIDPQNVQGLIDKANLLLYAPRVMGGNKHLALSYFLKAASIMEKKKDTHQNWVYMNLLTMIAKTYDLTDKTTEAKSMFEKILRIEPNFVWIKDDLYPKFLARLAR